MTPVEIRAIFGIEHSDVLGLRRFPRQNHEYIIHEVATRLPTKEGKFRIHLFRDRDGKEHMALVNGDVRDKEGVLTRVHSECMTGDVFGSLRCDCGPQLHHAMRILSEEEVGILVYLRQEGRGIGIGEKLKAYNLQDEGLDTVDANLYLGHKAEQRSYTAAAEILRELGVGSIRLLSNNPDKEKGLRELGIEVVGRVPLEPDVNTENLRYLKTKIDRMGHDLPENALHPHLPEMDDVARYIEKGIKDKKGAPFITMFSISGLDGTLTSDPASLDPNRPYKNLRERLYGSHDAVLGDPKTIKVPMGKEAGVSNFLVFHPTLQGLDMRGLPERTVVLTIDPNPEVRTALERSGHIVLDVSNDEGSLSEERLLGALFELGPRSILVDGRADIADRLLAMGAVDAVVNVVLPVMSGGQRVKRFGRPLRFRDIRTAALGTETVYFGRPEIL